MRRQEKVSRANPAVAGNLPATATGNIAKCKIWLDSFSLIVIGSHKMKIHWDAAMQHGEKHQNFRGPEKTELATRKLSKLVETKEIE